MPGPFRVGGWLAFLMKALVVGGGASGFMAAISLKRLRGDAKVVVAEKNDRALKKVIASGNGRCNITNRLVSPSGYNAGASGFVAPALSSFGFAEAAAFFGSIGVELAEEEEGRVYPMSRQASSVVDLLRAEAARLGVREKCGVEVLSLKRRPSGFAVSSSAGRDLVDRVFLCSGSASGGGSASGYSLARSLGHSITPLFPALVQVRAEGTRALHGIKFTGGCSVIIGGRAAGYAAGEILFTEYGLSGPPVMRLSRLVGECFSGGSKEDVFLSLNLMPGLDRGGALDLLLDRRRRLAHLPSELFLAGMVNKKLSMALMKSSGVSLSSRAGDISDSALEALAGRIGDWRFRAVGVNPLSCSQVTAGGVSLQEVDPDSMESRICGGLYVTGELLDVDGICGGYNLHWAWASGFAAARHAADG